MSETYCNTVRYWISFTHNTAVVMEITAGLCECTLHGIAKCAARGRYPEVSCVDVCVCVWCSL